MRIWNGRLLRLIDCRRGFGGTAAVLPVSAWPFRLQRSLAIAGSRLWSSYGRSNFKVSDLGLTWALGLGEK